MNIPLIKVINEFNELIPRYCLRMGDRYRIVFLTFNNYFDLTGSVLKRCEYNGLIFGKKEFVVKEKDYEKRKA